MNQANSMLVYNFEISMKIVSLLVVPKFCFNYYVNIPFNNYYTINSIK